MSVMPADQASRLRDLMNARPAVATAPLPRPEARPVAAARPAGFSRTAKIIAIASGKGGVGKTNIAVNLAIALAHAGRSVVLVDADLGTANADLLLDAPAPYDLSHVIRGKRTIDEVTFTLDSGPRFIRGASGLSSAADLDTFERERLVDQLARLEQRTDIILLDCGAGISRNVAAFAQAADELLLVTTPEPTALTDAYALVKVLAHSGHLPSLGLVVNQAASIREAQLVADRIAAVAERFLGLSLESRGHILRDQHVARAVRQRTPFVLAYPRCPAAACIAALARRVDSPTPDRSDRPSFFGRVLGLFY